MSDRTIQDIRAEFSSSSAATLNRYQARLDEIMADTEPEAGAYLERLSDEQRRDLLIEQKMERAKQVVERARKDYTSEVERYHAALSKRKEYLTERLFKVEDAGALSRAALATGDELGALLGLAARAQNAELGRAVFVAAEQRDLGELMAAYFDKINPEGRGLYQEWVEVPPAEVFERQIDNVDVVIPDPDPDSLMPKATAVWS
jgi:predicted metalloprotease with PDZ domain